jgi:hypothetical protein
MSRNSVKVQVTWRGDEYNRAIMAAVERGLTKAAIVVHEAATNNLAPVYGNNARTWKVTGRLRASLSWRVGAGKVTSNTKVAANEAGDFNLPGVDDLKAVVGTNVVYARAIEFGHSKMVPGGYLRAALKDNTDRITRLIQSEIKGVR